MSKKQIRFIVGLVTFSITAIVFFSGQASLPGIISSIFTHPITWTSALQDFAPSCDAVGNPVWVIPDGVKSSTNVQCSIQGLEMIPSSTAPLAEIDLDRINGQAYSQTQVDAKISVTFGKADSNTMAGLLVQTPQQGLGGYGLAINNTGRWELVDNNGHRQASGGLTTPRTVFNIELKVQDGKLYGLIDGVQMFKHDDTFNQSQSAVGLIIYGSKSPLSSVYFSDFELDL